MNCRACQREMEYTVLHTFNGYDGAEPSADLILDGEGNLYSTAAIGGAYGAHVSLSSLRPKPRGRPA